MKKPLKNSLFVLPCFITLMGCGGGGGGGGGVNDHLLNNNNNNINNSTQGPVHTCTGTSVGCELTSPDECLSQQGCTPQMDCTGFASSCSYFTDMVSCYNQLSCQWDSGSSICSGSVMACQDLNEYDCNRQEGCEWTAVSCAGSADPCQGITSAQSCQLQSGCRWSWSTEDLTQKGELGFPCKELLTCNQGLACINEICVQAGGAGQPCLPGGQCNAGNLCIADLCTEAGGEDQPCLPGDMCNGTLQCFAGTCVAAGLEGQPCFSDKTCAQGFACAASTCRFAVQGRFCHCLASGGQSIDLVMRFGEVEFPPVATQHCSACMSVPTGSVPFVVYWDNEPWEDGVIQFNPPSGGEAAFFVTTSELLIFEAECNASLSCP